MISDLSLVLGNQLVKPSLIPHLTKHPIFMCESDDLCTHFKYHQLKLIFFLTAMREYNDELQQQGVTCFYHELPDKHTQHFLHVLDLFCTEHQVKTLHMITVEDHFFDAQLNDFCQTKNIKRVVYDSPLFLTTTSEFKTYLDSTKKPFMKVFYEQQRKRFNCLMDGTKPKGGKWSFDEDNRKKTPKNITFPEVPQGTQSRHLTRVKKLIQDKFSDHIGVNGMCWFPASRHEVHVWLDNFIANRFEQFGHFEDAIDYRSDFLFHSALSPFINCGLITPQEILTKIEGIETSLPLNSVEGFIRQIIGWREFIRGIYHHFDSIQQTTNFFNHTRKLSTHWYTATTGIAPLDDAINQVLTLGYTHHINRLMVIGNIMLLCRIDPQDVYKWFMECFIDSSDWVMGPNVFGMSQFSDGGIFATKPYFCGSNYIRKMSHYPKGNWCATLDALYWQFIIDHQAYFSKNYRMKFMVSKAKSFSSDRLEDIHQLSSSFIDKVTVN